MNLFDQTPEQRRVTNAQLTAKGRVEWVGVRHDLAVGLENSHEKDDWAGGTAFVTNFGTTNLYAPVELAKPGVTFWTHSGDRAVDATNTVFAPGYNLFSLGLRHQRRVAGKNSSDISQAVAPYAAVAPTTYG